MATPQHFFRTVEANDSGEHDSYSIPIGNDLELHVAGYSHVGMKRKHNEDNYLLQDGLLVVCDGMGGHQSGEVASEIACTTLGTYFAAPPTIEKNLITLAEEANTTIYQEAKKDAEKQGMGTTLVVARFNDDAKINFTHAGDARLYRYSLDDHILDQLTVDHSLGQEKVDAGQMTKEDLKTYRHRNILTLSLGYEKNLTTTKMKEHTLDCSAGDVYLLCSDGLTVLDDDVIRKVMDETYAAHPDNDLAVAQALVAAANAAGGPDNITVVLARVASLSLEKLIKDGLDAVAIGDSDTVLAITRKYSDQLRTLGSSKADFLLGVASEANNMQRQALQFYERTLTTTPITDRDISHGSYFRQTIEKLIQIYGSVYGSNHLHFQTHFDKLCTLRNVEEITDTVLQETIEGSLVQRIARVGKELIENYSPTTKTSPAARELEKLARDARVQEIPRVRDAFVSIYTALTECAITAGRTSDAVHFIDCVQAVDSSVSVFKTFIQEGIPHLNYQQAHARFAIGEAPEHVLDVLWQFSVEEYNSGAGAVLFLQAQCLEKQGKRKEALAALEQAVAADCSDERYGVERQDVFVACAQHLYVERDFSRLHSLFSQGKDFSDLMDYRMRVIERVYQKCVEATDRNDLKKSREYARQTITVEAGSLDAVTIQHEKSLKAAFRIAATYQQEQRHREARDAYRQFLKLPQLQDSRYSHAEAWYKIAQTYVAEGRPEKAKEAATYALRLDPQHPARTFLLR